MIHRLAARRGQQGFTLVELLVVVAIMAILSAVVVFAVQGVGDKGGAAAVAVDERILRTAEEARCAQVGEYADEDILVDEGWLAAPSAIHDVTHTPGTGCGTYTVSCQGGAAPPCAPPAGGGGGGGPGPTSTTLPPTTTTTTLLPESCRPVSPATFTHIGRPEFGQLFAAWFLDADRGWIGGESGTVWATQDGGVTWTATPRGATNSAIRALYFADSNRGWLAGHRGVHRTTDGGTTWAEATFFDDSGLPMSPNPFIDAFSFSPDLSVGYAAGVNGIFTSDDGGATWTLRIRRIRGQGGFSAVTATTAQVAHAGERFVRDIYGTRDGGASWALENRGPLDPLGQGSGAHTRLSFASVQHGHATGPRGEVLATSDGGQTWLPVQSCTTQTLHGLDFVSPSVGIATGWDGTVIRTRAGGTWGRDTNVGTSAVLTDVALVSPSLAYIVGWEGTLIKGTFG